jgi:putative hydrolase of the HAD superfamily
MALIRGVVFDLDDTLYLERDFVWSGFRHVAVMLGGLGEISVDEALFQLWHLFQRGVRGDTFDRLLDAHPRLAKKIGVEDLVSAYRSHMPSISLLPGSVNLLRCLRTTGVRIGILSDGPLDSQRAKVRALRLNALVAPVILTDSWGRQFWKPDPRGYLAAAQLWGLEPGELMYIGDNPAKDFVTPRRLGWQTVRLRTPGQLWSAEQAPTDDFAPHREICCLEQLRDLWGTTDEDAIVSG